MGDITTELIARRNNKPTKWEMKGEKLKACPFCGDSHIHLVQDDWMHWVCCTSCGVEGPIRDTRLNAIKLWQRRPKSKHP